MHYKNCIILFIFTRNIRWTNLREGVSWPLPSPFSGIVRVSRIDIEKCGDCAHCLDRGRPPIPPMLIWCCGRGRPPSTPHAEPGLEARVVRCCRDGGVPLLLPMLARDLLDIVTWRGASMLLLLILNKSPRDIHFSQFLRIYFLLFFTAHINLCSSFSINL